MLEVEKIKLVYSTSLPKKFQPNSSSFRCEFMTSTLSLWRTEIEESGSYIDARPTDPADWRKAIYAYLADAMRLTWPVNRLLVCSLDFQCPQRSDVSSPKQKTHYARLQSFIRRDGGGISN